MRQPSRAFKPGDYARIIWPGKGSAWCVVQFRIRIRYNVTLVDWQLPAAVKPEHGLKNWVAGALYPGEPPAEVIAAYTRMCLLDQWTPTNWKEKK